MTSGPASAPAAALWRPFLLAAGVVSVWLAALVALALTTANPVTVNRDQLLTSDAVVVAEPVATPGGASWKAGVRLRVERTLAGPRVPDETRVHGVDPAWLRPGARYVVPLRGSATDYLVTPAPNPTPRDTTPDDPAERAYVYPATPDVLRHVEAILETGTPKPYP